MQLSVYAKAFKRSFAKRLYGTSNGSWLLEVCNTRKCGVSLPARCCRQLPPSGRPANGGTQDDRARPTCSDAPIPESPGRQQCPQTGRHQIGTHIGEVGITAIIIFRPVTGILQTACNGRDRLRLTGILHYAGSGLCRIPAQYGNQPASVRKLFA